MKTNNNSKATKIIATIYLITNIISLVYTIVLFVKDKFGVSDEVRKIGDFNVTLKSDSFANYGGVVAETYPDFNKDKNITVTTDMFFKMMPVEMQNCVLAHECGHHLHSKPRFVWDLSNGRDLQDEHMADTYSVELYGKEATIKMLKRLFIISLSPEVLQRIKMIKAM